jgi:FkbM family methyltransferase
MNLTRLLDPGAICQRLGAISHQRQRLRRLRHTVARPLSDGHIGSLELLEIASRVGIRAIYDIGANVGTWTLLAKALHPQATVEAFEPLPRHLTEFRRNVAQLSGTSLHEVALGASNGSAVMHVMDFSDASSLLPPAPMSRVHFGVSESASVELMVRRLDDYRLEHSLPIPDLLKLDVQGYELEVLRGAPQTLAAAKAVIAEVSFVEYYVGQCMFHEVTAFMAEHGLFLVALGVQTPLGKELAQTDVLFLRN